VGFEPTEALSSFGGFQDRCLKPLGHPSIYLIYIDKLVLCESQKTAFATILLPNRPEAAAMCTAAPEKGSECSLVVRPILDSARSFRPDYHSGP
jgi:hypothetical protein